MSGNIEEYSQAYLADFNRYEREHAAPMRRDITQREIGGCANKHILEVGCGMAPMFKDVDDFRQWTVVEPAAEFFHNAKQVKRDHPLSARIHVVRGFFAEVAASLSPNDFDVILLSGLLHEVPSPHDMLRAAHHLAAPQTLVHGCVPNAHSFHRLLAVEMGLIDSVFQPSNAQQRLQQPRIYDTRSFRRLFRRAGFNILSAGTHVFKPFTHEQMSNLWHAGFLTPQMAEGLAKMSKHCPALGSEIFINAQKITD